MAVEQDLSLSAEEMFFIMNNPLSSLGDLNKMRQQAMKMQQALQKADCGGKGDVRS